ncbi:MAG: hypothetical protein ACYSWO_28970 [Planctomycetota bacterium]|jgi:hypothetical protein
MSYSTNYSLEHNLDDTEQAELFQHLEDVHMGELVGYDCECSWYEHEEDMSRISRVFPEATFTLTGIGQQFGDAWKKRFRNGEVEEVRALLEWPEFTELPDEED